MKKVYILFLFILSLTCSNAQDLGLLFLKEHSVNDLIEDSQVKVFYFNNEFAVASFESKHYDYIYLDKAGKEDYTYVVFFKAHSANLTSFSIINEEVLFENKDIKLLKLLNSKSDVLYEHSHHGFARIIQKEYLLPEKFDLTTQKILFKDEVNNYLQQVEKDSMIRRIGRLEVFGTRDCKTIQSVSAQNWIMRQFNNYNLEVEIQDFPVYFGQCSDNVIAVLKGSELPDEYVVIGAHYDSRSVHVNAPGADDNASGVSGILEVARILKDANLKRSVIFIAFSGEEYGLYGSEAYANRARTENMNILAYLNMDMIGYLKPGTELHTDLIYPYSAKPLADFYKSVCKVYLPNFKIYDGSLTGGDSDHTSFNRSGYQGIFPFEDARDYSPYIHTENDVYGLSVNNMELAKTMTQAILANVLILANGVWNVGQDDFSELEESITIYPNPNQGVFRLDFPDEEVYDMEILNLSGQSVFIGRASNSKTVKVEGLNTGVYIARFKSGERVYTRRFIVEKN